MAVDLLPAQVTVSEVCLFHELPSGLEVVDMFYSLSFLSNENWQSQSLLSFP